MAAKATIANGKVYDKIGDELVAVAGTGIPDALATMTNFRAIDANMADAAFLTYEINGTDYAIPLLLTT